MLVSGHVALVSHGDISKRSAGMEVENYMISQNSVCLGATCIEMQVHWKKCVGKYCRKLFFSNDRGIKKLMSS